MKPYQLLEELLQDRPDARKTENLHRVYEFALRYYGAISHDGKWNSKMFESMPSLQTIDRELRKVKEDNGWKDQKAREKEEEYRKLYTPTPTPKPAQIARMEVSEPIVPIPKECEGKKGLELSKCIANLNAIKSHES